MLPLALARKWGITAREMFVPLVHPPGHAQADFGEAVGIIGGVKRKIHFFTFDLPHSDACFVVGYPAETTEAFCDGHVRAFAFFGGVPQSILYDNTKLAVAQILGDGKRERSRMFATLQSHYLFADKFGRPGKGNDKGGVEGLVGFAPPPDKWGTEDEPTRLHPSQGVIPEVLEQFVVARWNDPEHLRQRVKEHHGQIAAIIFEPVLCNTGCMPPVPGMIDTIRELCDENGIVMIADETITGFRFAPGGAQEYLGFTPDLTILGKAIGGGVPFAALVGGADLADGPEAEDDDPGQEQDVMNLHGALRGGVVSGGVG